jgi:hypothetical protein
VRILSNPRFKTPEQSHNMRRIFLVIFFYFIFTLSSLNALRADDFIIKITGPNLDNLSALSIKLALDPKKYCELDKEININKQTFFKNVDPQGSLINASFKTSTANLLNTKSVSAVIKDSNSETIEIKGKLKRLNYTGKLSVKVLNAELIPDFGKELDSKLISTVITISKEDEILPFYGITKAKILGPNPRLYSKKMFISIGDIESYGFNLEKNITNMKINNQKADLINKKMIIANIALEEIPENMKLPIILSMMVAGKEVKKNIGVIDLIESVELR